MFPCSSPLYDAFSPEYKLYTVIGLEQELTHGLVRAVSTHFLLKF